MRYAIVGKELANRNARRDPFVDGLRGVFHIVMLLDHLPVLFPGMFSILAGFYESLGYVTVAEGFVFLSGFVSGLVYTRILREHGSRAVWRKALIRARDIFFCYITSVVFLVALLKSFGISQIRWSAWYLLINEPFPTMVFKLITLQYQPTFLEILPMYSVFIAATPLILAYLERGRFRTVVFLSVLTWLAAQFDARQAFLKLLPFAHSGHAVAFDLLGWQLLFIFGLICGRKTYSAREPWLKEWRKVSFIAYAIAVVLFLLHQNILPSVTLDKTVDRVTLGPLRLLNFFCIAFLLCKARPFIGRCLAWEGFSFLSKYSLQVFAFHLFPLYFASFLISAALPSVWAQFGFITVGIVGLFQIAFFAHCFKRLHPNGRNTSTKLLPDRGD